ncbi:MAG: hypothetical protein Q9P01_11995 [Anaerolineae bacterium]|nr:hypothetical protein [Anaerolineae bacterium]MDQ7035521.1 hypothetical protein [Anaerolineae bacterium]
MNENWLDHKPNCFIEFRVNDNQRFELFMRFFKPLKAWTHNLDTISPNIGTVDDDSTIARIEYGKADTQEHFSVSAIEETKQRREFSKPEEWLLALRPQDLEFLGMPQHAPSVIAMRSWQGLSRRERRKAIREQGNTDELRVLADFADMLRYWQDVEFELIECDRHESDRARITYSTFGFPFEGKVALEETLMFFGFFSIITDSC